MEVAFFHKQSKILLLTDAVIFVPEKPPEVVGKQALLSAAKNGLAVKLLSAGKEVSNDPIIDDEATRQRGNNMFFFVMDVCTFVVNESPPKLLLSLSPSLHSRFGCLTHILQQFDGPVFCLFATI